MSLDRSLKGTGSLQRHRNVLKRSQRITTLEEAEKWTEGKGSVFGLVKVGHRKAVAAKKVKKEDAAAAVAGAAPAAGAAAPAAAPAAKGGPAAKGAPAGKGAPAAKGGKK
jgi:small basic protein (TIGR04137 family)